ncbi:MAG: beta-ketoacyl synthase N-terminal-like domain-containing protein [Thermodesulfobacteriota bacterium]
MTGVRVCIAGIGLVSPVACGVSGTRMALKQGKKGIGPLTLFPVSRDSALPVGEVRLPVGGPEVPRTHHLALIAAKEAMGEAPSPPDAIILGGTTGGMLETEECFKSGKPGKTGFRYHAPSSVAEYLAAELQCSGPVVTVSTACSSGAAAIKMALEMLRGGQARRILVGGADGLCRLTYYGFRSLQLIDPAGARPLDADRHGMTLSEGAGMLLLEASRQGPGGPLCEVLGAGLSCDAYHPSSPDPRGTGALTAMRAALEDAGVSRSGIDYINVHGTGTKDNDFSEAKALTALFGENMPPLSSVKGAMGHSLAAAGAIEAGIAAMTIEDGLIPGTMGCDQPDPQLGLRPVMEPADTDVGTVLSNAFGFGGNNASVVIGRSRAMQSPDQPGNGPHLTVVGSDCITGAGDMLKTLRAVSENGECQGIFPETDFSLNLPARSLRRFRRLPRMALSLAIAAHQDAGIPDDPAAVFVGTGWGPLSETYEFLTRVQSCEETFSSPTGFVGSVHNAPAGHIAIHFRATGPNITITGGDYSFEQSLMAAGLLMKEADVPVLVMGADEFHPTLSRRFDPSVGDRTLPADGGGALCVMRTQQPSGIRIGALFFENPKNNPSIITSLVHRLGGVERINAAYGALLAGIPSAYKGPGREQLKRFCSHVGFTGPVIQYRRFMGEFASASAVAAALGAAFTRKGFIPAGFVDKRDFQLSGKGILMAGLGPCITAVEIIPEG